MVCVRYKCARQAGGAIAVFHRGIELERAADAQCGGLIAQAVEAVEGVEPTGDSHIPSSGNLVDLDTVHQFKRHGAIPRKNRGMRGQASPPPVRGRSIFVGAQNGQEIGRAHVWTPVTNAHLVCRRLLEKKKIHKMIYKKIYMHVRWEK